MAPTGSSQTSALSLKPSRRTRRRARRRVEKTGASSRRRNFWCFSLLCFSALAIASFLCTPLFLVRFFGTFQDHVALPLDGRKRRAVPFNPST